VACCFDNSAWRTVAEILTAADFHRPDHRLIFAAIGKLARKGYVRNTCKMLSLQRIPFPGAHI
jgi:replicative DNA helicase